MKILKRNLFLTSIVSLGTLAANFVAQGNALFMTASLFVAKELLKSYQGGKSEEDKIKQLPSFFYWEASNKK